MRAVKSINAGIRLTPSQREKWNFLANRLGVKRNQVIGLLIDSAEVQVNLLVPIGQKNNRRDAQVSTASITAVSA